MKNNYSRLKWVALIIIGGILFFLSKTANAATTIPLPLQQQEVSGLVQDQNGLPIPGVTVSVKNTNRGTVTNLDGEYSVSAPANGILVFSYIGYKTVEIPVDNNKEISIQLDEDISALGEVQINAGYYNTTKRESTGSISKVTAEEIELQPTVNPLQALQGRVAGLEVVDQSGVPGAAPNIRIRGQNSLRNTRSDNGNLPLYIVDGVPINSSPVSSINQSISSTGTDPLNGLNISNIESIEILKDADATAIYGSRGANGVILITTKGGSFKGGKDKIEARFYSGISRVSHFVDLLDTPQYLALRRQAFENDGVEPTIANAKDLLLWDQERNTDWQEVLYGKSAPTLNANLNYSGGGENTSFSVGASYFKQGSVFPGNYSFEKKTINLNLNHQSNNQKFRLNLSVNYGINDNDIFSSNNFVRTALSLPPNAPEVYQDDGRLNWENSTWDNPFSALESEGKSNTDNLIANAGLQYHLLEGLTIKANLGYTHLDSEENILLPIEIYDPAIWNRVANRSQHSFINRKSWIAEPQLVYTGNYKKHNVDALIGATFQRNDNSQLRIIGTGYADRHLIGNLEAADAVDNSQDRDLVYKYNALFARVGYNWDHTYFLNLTGRRDGSSRFGPDNRFANFGAIGAAWIFSNDSFVSKHLPFISFGKIRGSYGITGNDQIGDYRYLDAYESTPGPGGLYPTQLTNPSFSWESNKKIEAALELGLLQDRINLNLSWYRNRSSNQLVGYSLPAITGFNTVEANLPATVQNTGVEIEFSTLNIQSEQFQWRSSLNLSIPSNKLIKFENIEETSYANTYKIGEPLNISILYEYDGIDPETGLFRVKDINQDGRFDFDDRVVSRNLGRQFYGGLNNQVNYENFSIGFLVEFVKQEGLKIYNSVPGFLGNTFQEDSNGWTTENTTAEVQKSSQSISALISYLNAYSSTYRLTDASFARLKTLSLGYNLPDKILKNVELTGVQLFLHGQNLFTVTNYKGLDPQNPGTIALPALQSITGGIQINF
ncbi:SusC/RagA family TonB-linked outer membrane protein [Salegentibacter sp. JZCK2]|uniref:SusC/RagA family TonB-linked outer membrane protein n=1 Tax=Salegentibacter tibetensis TaxID=2873600 RepID=UPI001CCA4405|nr:SusC/RagA family TonB-linked outer membrane protein [Salegentibacter tibetensis]MBZ9730769.1 SusC/RagA family TonB-linked outer membrane protein [Salegentibacter tibetensis]